MMAAVEKATRSDTQRPPLRVRAELLAAATTAQLSYLDDLDADIDRRRAVQRAAPLRTLRRVAQLFRQRTLQRELQALCDEQFLKAFGRPWDSALAFWAIGGGVDTAKRPAIVDALGQVPKVRVEVDEDDRLADSEQHTHEQRTLHVMEVEPQMIPHVADRIRRSVRASKALVWSKRRPCRCTQPRELLREALLRRHA